MKKTDLYWLAGLLEGEGSFHISSDENPRPTISLHMTDEEPVRRAASLMEISNRVYKRPPSKDSFGKKDVWYISLTGAKEVAHLCRLIRSIMSPRRQTQIDAVLWRCDQIYDDWISGFQKAEIIKYIHSRWQLSGSEISRRTGIETTSVNDILNGEQERIGHRGAFWGMRREDN